MDRLLKDYREFCCVFIDDIVIFSDIYEEYIQYLYSIFFLFSKKNVSLSPEKSFIGYPFVELLGFYIDTLGIHSTEKKTQSFRKLEFPNTLKTLKTYLKATDFLRNIIPYYVQISDILQ